MHVCLHGTGHRCVVTNTQHSWSHWLHCRTKMEARCHARRAAVAALRAGGLAPSICLAQWSWLQSPMRGWQSITHCAQQCPGRLVPTALCTAQCPGLSLQRNVQACLYSTMSWLVSTAQCPGLSLQHNVLACLYSTVSWLVSTAQCPGLSLQHNVLACLYSTMSWLPCPYSTMSWLP